MKKILLILSVLLICIVICGCSEYNKSGVSFYLEVTTNEDSGLKMVGQNDEYTVYTFNLSDCCLKTSSGGTLSITEALEENKVTVEDMISKLTETESKAGRVFFGDGYQVTLLDQSVVISPIYDEKK